MSIFTKKKQSKEARKRMEHLMYLAKESPDKKYDLSACELTEIPSSVFSLCKVLQKEVLLLHTNLLKNLKMGGKMADLANLRILDLHSNRLTDLPQDIHRLKNLQVLNIENNRIATLPSELGLVNLQTLNARDNKLQGLPNSIKDLKSLRTLDISGTNKVIYLPKTICHVRTLEVVVLSNSSQMEYPPAHIAQQGLEEMMKFICKDVGVEYVPPAHNLLPLLDGNRTSAMTDDAKPQQEEQVVNAVLKYEKIKEDKRQKQIEIERHLYETQQEQAILASKSLHNRAVDLKNITDEQEKFDKSVQRQQIQQERERKRMIALLVDAEKNAGSLVKHLLEMNEKVRKQEALFEEMERKRMEEEEYFKVTKEDLDNLRKKDTLAAMKSILLENDHFAILTQKYLAEQSRTARKAHGLIQSEEKNLEVVISKQHEVQNRLVQELQNEEELQRQAFTALQFEQDFARRRIVNQIQQVEQALADLTAVELKKNKYKMESEKEVLQSKRQELTDLLVVLLKEKDVREEMLQERLVEMEEQKENNQLDFWLVQYQRLLDSKPERLVERETMMDVPLIKFLTKAGAEHHIPSFARHKVVSISDLIPLGTEDLRRIGVFEIAVQNNILRLIEEEIATSKKLDSYEASTSSPETTPIVTPVETPTLPEPTAPEPSSELSPVNECVVCMENETSTVFLPCGHVCACAECSKKLYKCPMCRCDIEQKIGLYRS